MKQEPLRLDVGDGEHIAAVVHEPADQPVGTVIFCHGFGSDKEGRYRDRAKIAAEEGFTAIRFDFRGNHESSRDFDEATLSTRIEDLERVIDEVDDGMIGVYGASFGGLVALHTAARNHAIDFVAVRAPVTYLQVLDDMAEAIRENGVYKHIPGKTIDQRFLDDLEQYSTREIIDDISVPVLIIHGTEDDVVPIESAEEFYGNLDTVKDFIYVEEQGHRFDDYEDCRAVMRSLLWFAENRNPHHVPE